MIPHSPACFPCSYSTTLSTKRKGYLCERCEVSALERFGGPLFWSIDSVSPVGQNLHHRVDVHHRLEGGRSWGPENNASARTASPQRRGHGHRELALEGGGLTLFDRRRDLCVRLGRPRSHDPLPLARPLTRSAPRAQRLGPPREKPRNERGGWLRREFGRHQRSGVRRDEATSRLTVRDLEHLLLDPWPRGLTQALRADFVTMVDDIFHLISLLSRSLAFVLAAYPDFDQKGRNSCILWQSCPRQAGCRDEHGSQVNVAVRANDAKGGRGGLWGVPELSGPEALAPLGAGVADPRLGVVHLEDVVRGEVREELSEEKEGEGVHRAQGRRLDQGPARAVVSRSPSPFLSGTLGSGNWFVCLFVSNSDALDPAGTLGTLPRRRGFSRRG